VCCPAHGDWASTSFSIFSFQRLPSTRWSRCGPKPLNAKTPSGWVAGGGLGNLLRLRLLGQHPPATDSYSHDRSVVLERLSRVNKQAIVMILVCGRGIPARRGEA